jgi:hypothetical protein
MYTVITLEDIRIKAATIPRQLLVSSWKSLTSKPFPKVKGFRLSDNDFEQVMHLRRCKEDERREREEWGRVLSTSGTDACVFNANETADVDYIILIREKTYHSLEEIIEHELSHIAEGDL